jgi:type II secretion system protein I
MTLLEVFLALTIFVGALAAVSQIISTGTRASVQAELQSDAVLRAETQMAQIVSGAIPLTATSNAAFDDHAEWTWSLTVATGPQLDTLQLTVTVDHKTPKGVVNGQAVLARIIRDPQVYVNAAAASSDSTGLELLQ